MYLNCFSGLIYVQPDKEIFDIEIVDYLKKNCRILDKQLKGTKKELVYTKNSLMKYMNRAEQFQSQNTYLQDDLKNIQLDLDINEVKI